MNKNKQLLWQAIKSVLGFFGVLVFVLWVLVLLSNAISSNIVCALVILSTIIGLIWLEYKNLKSKQN
jgi:hypothetical protein